MNHFEKEFPKPSADCALSTPHGGEVPCTCGLNLAPLELWQNDGYKECEEKPVCEICAHLISNGFNGRCWGNNNECINHEYSLYHPVDRCIKPVQPEVKSDEKGKSQADLKIKDEEIKRLKNDEKEPTETD